MPLGTPGKGTPSKGTPGNGNSAMEDTSEEGWTGLDPSFTPEDGKFFAELTRFFRDFHHVELGKTPGWKVPLCSGHRLNLALMYREVQKYGGYEKVTQEKLWKVVAEKFEFPKSAIRTNYEKFLKDYEQRQDPQGSAGARSPPHTPGPPTADSHRLPHTAHLPQASPVPYTPMSAMLHSSLYPFSPAQGTPSSTHSRLGLTPIASARVMASDITPHRLPVSTPVTGKKRKHTSHGALAPHPHKGKEEKVAELTGKAAALLAAVKPSVGPYLAIPPNFLTSHVHRVALALSSGVAGEVAWALNALSALSADA
eukprot:CAMPEP_0118942950 /NCGR_PEP_ID=MMETSP1169-20130426/37208_1 /TAXON_ID=36882 /ORGANISM="Pyramimonas obovata, Strain CCMP722" /LENGTH=310 /DNA_ID=CAMNT_0006888073 /DNA_START=257 /DNA_END=1185 /DNA_ORIENTATION=-